MTLEEFFARQWQQFQLFDVYLTDIEVIIAGTIEHVNIGEHRRIAVQCSRKLRRQGAFQWEELETTDPFFIPGPIDRLTIELTPKGRAIVISSHPKEDSITIFIPADDDGDWEELDKDTTIGPLKFDQLNVTQPSDVRPPVADDDIPF